MPCALEELARAPGPAARSEQRVQVARHLFTHDAGHHGAHLRLHACSHLGRDRAATRQREQTRTAPAATDESFLLAPRVVRHRRDAELLLHVVRREALSLCRSENLGALLRRVGLSRTLRHATSKSGGTLRRGGMRGEYFTGLAAAPRLSIENLPEAWIKPR